MHITKKFTSEANFQNSNKAGILAASVIEAIQEYVAGYEFDAELSNKITACASLHLDTLIRQASNDQEIEFDAYGNDAEYWHDEFSKIFDAKDIIDGELQKECKHLQRANIQLRSSRDSWKSKYEELKKDYDKVYNEVPKEFRWPKLHDGELIVPGMRLKSKLSGKCIRLNSVEYDGTSVFVVDQLGCAHSESDLEYPDPETPESILKELAPSLTDEQIASYIDRLNKVDTHESTEQAD